MNEERQPDPARPIIVVDDVGDCGTALEVALLAIDGVSVRFVGAAEDALRALDSGDFSALITDVHLPRMSGLELVEFLRSQPRWQRLPVVVISGDTDPRTPARALHLGADAFFAKPYSPAAVRRKVEELIHVK
jgi:CheY-like chemotaxis protein